MINQQLFEVLTWGSIALVAVVFLYELYALLTEYELL